MAKTYFYKVPNQMIRAGNYDNAKWICLYYALDEVRNCDDDCNISTSYLTKSCGLSPKSREHLAIIRDCLNTMIEKEIISVVDGTFPQSSCNKLITVRIDSWKFDSTENFTKLYSYEYHTIMNSNYNIRRKKHLLLLYLYLKSHCYYSSAGDIKYGYTQSLISAKADTRMSVNLLIDLLNNLVDLKLLHKTRVGSIKTNNGKMNVPCIYIPRLKYTSEEIAKIRSDTLGKMKEKYKVEAFEPFVEGFGEN